MGQGLGPSPGCQWWNWTAPASDPTAKPGVKPASCPPVTLSPSLEEVLNLGPHFFSDIPWTFSRSFHLPDISDTVISHSDVPAFGDERQGPGEAWLFQFPRSLILLPRFLIRKVGAAAVAQSSWGNLMKRRSRKGLGRGWGSHGRWP